MGKRSARGASGASRGAAKHLTSQEGDRVKELWLEYMGAVGRPEVEQAVKWLMEEKGLTVEEADAMVAEWWGSEPEDIHVYPGDEPLTAQHPPTGELPPLAKGTIVYANAWPAIVMERSRRKHNTRIEPVYCEIWGYHHELGSAYRKDIFPALSMDVWKNDVRKMGGDPEDRYFEGDLVKADPDQGHVFRIMGKEAQESVSEKVDTYYLDSENFIRDAKADFAAGDGERAARLLQGAVIMFQRIQDLYRLGPEAKAAVPKTGGAEAYQKLLDEVRGGGAVLTGGAIHPDIPTIHDVGHQGGKRLKSLDEVRHLGFGFFEGNTPSGKFSFDAGGAMRHEADFSWTPLRADPGVLSDLGYDLGRVERALVELTGEGQ